eukprot:Rmarinus@m.3589
MVNLHLKKKLKKRPKQEFHFVVIVQSLTGASQLCHRGELFVEWKRGKKRSGKTKPGEWSTHTDEIHWINDSGQISFKTKLKRKRAHFKKKMLTLSLVSYGHVVGKASFNLSEAAVIGTAVSEKLSIQCDKTERNSTLSILVSASALSFLDSVGSGFLDRPAASTATSGTSSPTHSDDDSSSDSDSDSDDDRHFAPTAHYHSSPYASGGPTSSHSHTRNSSVSEILSSNFPISPTHSHHSHGETHLPHADLLAPSHTDRHSPSPVPPSSSSPGVSANKAPALGLRKKSSSSLGSGGGASQSASRLEKSSSGRNLLNRLKGKAKGRKDAREDALSIRESAKNEDKHFRSASDLLRMDGGGNRSPTSHPTVSHAAEPSEEKSKWRKSVGNECVIRRENSNGTAAAAAVSHRRSRSDAAGLSTYGGLGADEGSQSRPCAGSLDYDPGESGDEGDLRRSLALERPKLQRQTSLAESLELNDDDDDDSGSAPDLSTGSPTLGATSFMDSEDLSPLSLSRRGSVNGTSSLLRSIPRSEIQRRVSTGDGDGDVSSEESGLAVREEERVFPSQRSSGENLGDPSGARRKSDTVLQQRRFERGETKATSPFRPPVPSPPHVTVTPTPASTESSPQCRPGAAGLDVDRTPSRAPPNAAAHPSPQVQRSPSPLADDDVDCDGDDPVVLRRKLMRIRAERRRLESSLAEMEERMLASCAQMSEAMASETNQINLRKTLQRELIEAQESERAAREELKELEAQLIDAKVELAQSRSFVDKYQFAFREVVTFVQHLSLGSKDRKSLQALIDRHES